MAKSDVNEPAESPTLKQVATEARRWLILGSGGSGKSTLARKMSATLDLPLIHLDQEYWGPDWTPTPPEAWTAETTRLAAQDAWVMDGNYSGTLATRIPRAQAVVLLDVHPLKCCWRIVKRRYDRAPRSDIPPDCSDRLTLEFMYWVLTYRRRSLPRVLARLGEYPNLPCWTLHTNRDVVAFTERLRDAV